MFFKLVLRMLFPVQRQVLFFSLHEHLSKHLPQQVVIRLFLKLERFHVLKVTLQNKIVFSMRTQQRNHVSILLSSAYLSILLGLRRNFDTLPRQLSDQEVK